MMTIMVQSTRTVRRWWVLKIRKMWNHNLYIIILGNPLQRMVGSKTPQTASTTSTVVSSQKTEEKNKEKSCLYDCFRPAPWWQLAACVRYTIIYIYMSVFAYACSVHMCYTCACLRVCRDRLHRLPGQTIIDLRHPPCHPPVSHRHHDHHDHQHVLLLCM